MKISIIIRTFNHARFLNEQLEAIKCQKTAAHEVEVVIADLGSTDGSIFLAEFYQCRIMELHKLQDNPIAALNLACSEADADILVLLSPESIPCYENWLLRLIEPLIDRVAVYSYGRLEASVFTEFSNKQYINTHFPSLSQIPQYGSYCNNANAAILKSTWKQFRFDESLTALEDIQMVKDIGQQGMSTAYVAEANVFDIKQEDFVESLDRHKHEGQSLQSIYPDIHFTLIDFLHYFVIAVFNDVHQAYKEKCLHCNLYQILSCRFSEYWGIYLGHYKNRKKSETIKQAFFNPKRVRHKKI